MKQIICDICGRVIKGNYTAFNPLSMHGGEVIQSHCEETSCDVCKPCALELYNLIVNFIKEKR